MVNTVLTNGLDRHNLTTHTFGTCLRWGKRRGMLEQGMRGEKRREDRGKGEGKGRELESSRGRKGEEGRKKEEGIKASQRKRDR